MKPPIAKKGPALFFLTTPTREMTPIFSLTPLAHQALLQLKRAVDEADAAIHGYALLPCSLYALIGFYGNYDLPGFMYNYKWLSSRAMVGLEQGEFHDHLFHKGKFKPWMNRFDNLRITSMELFNAKLKYLHFEPVRLGLAADPLKWEFSSARYWKTGEPGLIKVEKDLKIFDLA